MIPAVHPAKADIDVRQYSIKWWLCCKAEVEYAIPDSGPSCDFDLDPDVPADDEDATADEDVLLIFIINGRFGSSSIKILFQLIRIYSKKLI